MHYNEKAPIMKVFYPFQNKYQSILKREKKFEFCSKCCKMALLALQFSIWGGGGGGVPPSEVALTLVEKNPPFSKNFTGSTGWGLNA